MAARMTKTFKDFLKALTPKPIKAVAIIGLKTYREIIQSQNIKRLKQQHPSIKSNAFTIGLSKQKNRRSDLALYTTYCGATKNKTLCLEPAQDYCEHFFASNNEDVLLLALQAGYTPIYLDLKVSDDPVLSAYQAKIAKAIPHTIEPLGQYDFLFYKDDKIQVDTSRIDEFIGLLQEKDSAIALRPHPFLSGNVLYEFGESMLQSRYKREWDKSIAYITQEVNNGARLNCQMYATGAILRNTKHPDTVKINELWWQHINRCGIECQVSFDIIAQKFDSIAKLPLNLE